MTPVYTLPDNVVYEQPSDELTQKEIEKILMYARAVKRKEIKRMIVEENHGRSGLYIEGSKRVKITV